MIGNTVSLLYRIKKDVISKSKKFKEGRATAVGLVASPHRPHTHQVTRYTKEQKAISETDPFNKYTGRLKNRCGEYPVEGASPRLQLGFK